MGMLFNLKPSLSAGHAGAGVTTSCGKVANTKHAEAVHMPPDTTNEQNTLDQQSPSSTISTHSIVPSSPPSAVSPSSVGLPLCGWLFAMRGACAFGSAWASPNALAQ